jgi:hypothetical protein
VSSHLVLAQQSLSPADPGIYVAENNGFTKIIGQIAEFKRSGSALVSKATVGIKAQKENIQLLGPHAQNVVSSQPVFYFIPAKQEADAGVNAGDLILIRLEEKPERRQFEIAAHGVLRSSSGISITHQIQLLRSEEQANVYKVVPAAPLSAGEYALYLSRGEGMAAYVYDFGVGKNLSDKNAQQSSTPVGVSATHVVVANDQLSDVPARSPIYHDASLGVFSDVNPNIRRDGITLKSVKEGGPADQVGIKPGDVILSIDGHYLFTVAELHEEITHHQPGTKVAVRYRHNSTIYDTSIVVGTSR